MNRSDIKAYFAQLKRGQQDSYVGEAKLLSEASQQPALPTIGGGLGRGLELAKQNLKNALETMYQEVVDGITDELGEESFNEQNQMAYEETMKLVTMVVKEFSEGYSVPSKPYIPHGFEDDDDPIRRMGFEDYQSDTGDGSYSEEYKNMDPRDFYDK